MAVPLTDAATPIPPESEDQQSVDQTIFESYIDDETYRCLKAHFLATGKGRRPTIPNLGAASFRMLVQMYFLKEDGQTTWKMVTEWYRKLWPSASVSPGQLEYRVKLAMTEMRSNFGDKEKICVLLNTSIDVNFHEIPKPLSAMGLTRTSLLSCKFDDIVLSESLILTNDLVYSLELFRSREKQSDIFFCNWIHKLLALTADSVSLINSQIIYRRGQMIKKIKGYQKNKSEDQLKVFLSNHFVTNSSVKKPTSSDSDNALKRLEIECGNMKKKLVEKEVMINELNLKFEALVEERQCLLKEKEILLALQSRTESLEVEEKALREANLNLQAELKDMEKTKFYKTNHRLRMTNKELKETNDSLSAQVLKKNEEIETLQQEAKQKVERALEEAQAKIESLQKKLRTERTLKSRYKLDLEKEQALSSKLVNEVVDPSHVKLKVPGTNRFTDSVRLACMALQGEASVAAENISKVIQIVSNYLFDTKFTSDDLPSPSSALNFMSEALIISQQQVSESLLASKHFMFGTDGTSRQKRHYLEKHVVLDDGKTLFLGYNEIPTDDAQTLLEVCIDAFQTLSNLYCDDHPNLDENVIQKELIKKLKCLMSDRAAVMKCFDEKMAAYKNELLGEESSTHFLFCNAHFLLGLSTAAIDAANHIESEIKASGTSLGRDSSSKFSSFAHSSESAVNRAIRTTAEVLGPRGDEKSGSREEWLAYLSRSSTTSLFTSFRSNRFNNLFQNATALLFHQEDIRLFISEYCTHSNLKLDSVLLDLKDHNIISFVAALAFYNEMLTTPYWNLMQSNTPYGQFPKYVKIMERTLSSWISEDFDPLTSTPVFEDFASNNVFIIQYLRTSLLDIDLIKGYIQEISKFCFTVFNRQLSDFLDGGVFAGHISNDVQQILDSCPLTNLTGERLFGDLDFDMHKRRHATVHLRNSLTMWKRNRTGHYLKRQSDKVRQKLVAKAIRLSPGLKKKCKEEHEEVVKKIKKRLMLNKQKKDEKSVKASVKKVSILDSVISHGGVCKTKKDLEDLMSRPNASECLRTQLRYRKFCLGEKVQVTGNSKILYERLLSLIEK